MIAGHPYPIAYEGYGVKVCPACMDNGRGQVGMQPHWARAVDEDLATLFYVCLRCGHNERGATRPLDEQTKRMMTAPAVKTRDR